MTHDWISKRRRRQATRWRIAVGVVVCLGVIAMGVRAADDDEAEVRIGFRKTTLSSEDSAAEGSREAPSIEVRLWYPTGVPAESDSQDGGVVTDAEPTSGQHPLLIFSHGYLGASDQSVFLVEALARAGYVVAAVEHADAFDRMFSKPAEDDSGEGRAERPLFGDPAAWSDEKFSYRRRDLVALLDRVIASEIAGAIDEQAIGALGHSLGGYSVAGLSGAWPTWRDERIRAALLLSPYVMPWTIPVEGDNGGGPQPRALDLELPVMVQGGTADFGITPFLPPFVERLTAPKYYLVLEGASHFEWTNLVTGGRSAREVIGPEGSASLALICAASIAFFDAHLRDKAEARELLRDLPDMERWAPAVDHYEVELETVADPAAE